MWETARQKPMSQRSICGENNMVLIINMHINLNNSAGAFLQLSPHLEHLRVSPYMGGLEEHSLGKYSCIKDQLCDFELQPAYNQQQGQLDDGSEARGDEEEPLGNDYLLDSNGRAGPEYPHSRDCSREMPFRRRQVHYNLQNMEDSEPQNGAEMEALSFGRDSYERENFEREADLNNPKETDKDPVSHKQCDSQIKFEHPSTRFEEVREEPSVPYMMLSRSDSRVQQLVEFLVENISKKEELLLRESRRIIQDSRELQEVFEILLVKFKRLRKTKEEMTKYCMRKAFKFIADKMKRDRTHNRDVDSCMKLYFSKQQTSHSFTIPFKKNSVEKTMNGNFLKRVFASQNFIEDYRDFLDDFNALMLEDNQKKVKYLSELIEECLTVNDIKKVESIKRLPWTKDTLMQTESLGISLMSYADSNEIIGRKRFKSE